MISAPKKDPSNEQKSKKQETVKFPSLNSASLSRAKSIIQFPIQSIIQTNQSIVPTLMNAADLRQEAGQETDLIQERLPGEAETERLLARQVNKFAQHRARERNALAAPNHAEGA